MAKRNEPRPPPKVDANKPHLVYRDGRWRLFRTRWKSQFKDAAQLSATTIPLLKQTLALHHDRHRWWFPHLYH